MGVFDELKTRGLLAQVTHEEKVRELLNNEKITFYIGFDPTADSLHVGHFLQMMIMARMQKAGHRPIALIGGGTGMVGDPSGRSDMRQMMTRETVRHNCDCFRAQMGKFIDFSDGRAVMVDNGDWLLNLNYVDFMRDYGVHFSVNRMLTAESFKRRLEKGLSFFEFNYMLMQSYDFLHLFREYGCLMQFGGDDQWSNIIWGAELIRRVEGKEAYGVTFTLLTTSEGAKMGKTAKGAVWLDPLKTPPYEFFQYWRNVADADVINCMKLLTFIPMNEIEEYEKAKDEKINEAKERLAFELTKTVHGEGEAMAALDTARALFSGGGSLENIPSSELSPAAFTDGEINICELLAQTRLSPSKGEARRLIAQGGIAVNGEKITDFKTDYAIEDFSGDFIIKKGKKVYHRVTVKR